MNTASSPSASPAPTNPGPTVTINGISGLQKTATHLNGTCSADQPGGISISVSSSAGGSFSPVTADCTDHTWSATVDLSSLAAGTFTYSVTATDVDGTVGSTPAHATTLSTSDTNLNTGAAGSITYNVGDALWFWQKAHILNGSKTLWSLFPDPYGTTSGSGTITMTYNGNGILSTTANLTGLNTAPVNAYPMINLGYDIYGASTVGQPLQFPQQLKSMASLIFDVTYSLTGTYSFGDVLFDEWLTEVPGWSGGGSGAVEVAIFSYNNQYTNTWGTFVRTFTVPVILNGTATTMSFNEYVTGTGGGYNVLFYPTTGGYSSASLRFDVLLFLNEAAVSAGLSSEWYVTGLQLGPEFGSGSSVNFNFSVTKLGVEQTLLP